MAEARTENPLSLSEHYALEEKDKKSDVVSKPEEVKEVENPVNAAPEEIVNEKVEETPAPSVPPSAEESTEASASASATAENSGEDASAAAESSETTAEEDSAAAEETPEVKLETAPADFRFPTTNQTRHCFTRYIEYHRCVAAKGEDAPECDKFAKYYRSLCPGEWIDRWNEQRENGTFPGPL